MKLNSAIVALLLPLLLISELHSQVPNSPTLPPGMKAQIEKMQKQSLKNAGIETDESSLSSFMAKIKTVKIGEDTPDDVINKLGKPWSRSKWSGVETFVYNAIPTVGTMIATSIQIGTSGKVTSVVVSKSSNQSSSELYSKGALEIPGSPAGGSQSTNALSVSDHFTVKETAPDNPTEGQIYFNKTEKHFYGWDGTSWLKLDAKP